MESQIALFIDFENLATGIERGRQELDLAAIIDYLKEKGRIVIRRAYADWGKYARYKDDLLDNNIDLTHLFSYRAKNRADIRLAADAMETVFLHKNIDIYAIVSGDSDFSELVSKLKEYGKYVIGIAPQVATSELLVKSCDEFKYYDVLVGEPAIILDVEEAKDLLVKAINTLAPMDERVLASVVKETMVRLEPSFDEKNYGYRQFINFLEDCRDVVKLSKEDFNVWVSLLTPAEKEAISSELPLYARYRAYLNRKGVRPVKPDLRLTIMKDFSELVKGSADERVTLKSAAASLKEQYDAQELIISKSKIQDVIRIIVRSDCLDFESLTTPAFSTPISLKEEMDFEKIVTRCDSTYLHMLIEGFKDVDLEQASIALYETPEKVSYLEDLLNSIIEKSHLKNDVAAIGENLK
jgi:uncharacterized protein (TIGR00288 family)